MVLIVVECRECKYRVGVERSVYAGPPSLDDIKTVIEHIARCPRCGRAYTDPITVDDVSLKGLECDLKVTADAKRFNVIVSPKLQQLQQLELRDLLVEATEKLKLTAEKVAEIRERRRAYQGAGRVKVAVPRHVYDKLLWLAVKVRVPVGVIAGLVLEDHLASGGGGREVAG